MEYTTLTVEALHKITQEIMDKGMGHTPVVLSVGLGLTPAEASTTKLEDENNPMIRCLVIRDRSLL